MDGPASSELAGNVAVDMLTRVGTEDDKDSA